MLPSIVVNAGPALLQHSPHVSVLSAQTIRSASDGQAPTLDF